MKLEGLDGVLETLKSLPPEVVSKNGGPVRRALAKGARLIRDQARANFLVAVNAPGKTGITNSTGFTEKQIVTKRKQLTQIKGERYIVTVRYVLHPANRVLEKARTHRRKGSKKTTKEQKIRANDIAYIMEYGSANQPATPWLRPAFESRKMEAIMTTEKALVQGIDRIVKKLALQNKGK